VGGTKVLGIVLDPADPTGTHLVEERVPTPIGTDAIISAMADLCATLRARAVAEHGRDVAALGVGLPGLVDREGNLRFAANLPGVAEAPFAVPLAERTGLPVQADNDATCAAWGEHERGASRGHTHSNMVTLGTGIGAGFTVKGEVLRGANGFAGEPGHMVVDPRGPMCPCGRQGCWERFASGTGLGNLAREAAHAGRASRVVELAGGDAEAVRGEHVTAAGREGDTEALDVLRRYGWWVAVGIANLVNLLDAEVVVIGGGLAAAGELVLEPTRDAFRELVFGGGHRPEVPIVAAELGESAGAVGAALLADARTAF
jgi:glucokinase